MKLGLTLAAIVLLASSASAQSPLGTQAFATNSSTGKTCTVTHYDDGTWSGCGLSVTAPNAASAASAFQLFTVAGDTAPVVSAPVGTTLPALAFIQRFTVAEQQANLLWAMQLSAAAASNGGQIDVTNPQLLAGMAQLVSSGTLTAARSAQILNLNVASP